MSENDEASIDPEQTDPASREGEGIPEGEELDDVLPEPEADPDPDQAWKALSNVNDWIKHAETKTSVVLAAAGVSGVMLFNLVGKQSDPGCWLSSFAVSSGVALVISVSSGAMAILPRLTIDPRKLFGLWRSEQDLSSLLFFTHVAKKYKEDAPTFVEVFRTLTSDADQLTRQVAQQVHANATVAHRKYRWANVAIMALIVDYAFLAVVAAIVGSK